MTGCTPSTTLRDLLATSEMGEMATAWDCLTARLVQEARFDGIAVGGGSIANCCYGVPDIGIISPLQVLEAVGRIRSAVTIPVIVDVDDGGATVTHIRRMVSVAEDLGTAGILMEDVDSGALKHLYRAAQPDGNTGRADAHNPFGTDRDFSANRLFEPDEALRRLDTALRHRRGDLVVIARTDAYLKDPARGLAESVERVQAYAKAGADAVFIVGLPRALLTRDLVSSLGAPLVHLEVGDVSPEARDELSRVGVKMLYHGHLPYMVGYMSVKRVLRAVKQGVPSGVDFEPFEAMRELLTTVDFAGWSTEA